MAFDSKGRRINVSPASNGDGPLVPRWVCVLIVCLPAACLYVGYSVGMHFTTGHSVLPDRHVVVDAARLNYTWYNSHNLSVTFRGNLGNELFQYAALYGLAKANGLKPLVPRSAKITRLFPNLKCLLTDDRDPGQKSSKFRELKAMAFDTRAFSLNFMKNLELVGFFQSWRYFDHVRAELRQQFVFPEQANSQVQDVLHEALKTSQRDFFDASKSVVFVGVHVRRGDLLSDESVRKGYVTAGQSYIEVAMDYFINKYKQVIFLVCTDDVAWSKAHVKMRGNNPVIFSPFDHAYPGIDLCLLSHCNHTIMTVGTFGWWGAWLAGGETVYYKKFPREFTVVSEEFKRADYFLPQWYGV